MARQRKQKNERYMVLELNFLSNTMKVILNPLIKKPSVFVSDIRNDLKEKCLNGSIKIGASIHTKFNHKCQVKIGIVRL